MTDPTTNSDQILKNLSRRKLLRNSAITAAGAVFLPSFITGCNKDVWEKVKEQIPGGGLGGVLPEPPPTLEELKMASQNLTNMIEWLKDLHEQQDTYEINWYFNLKGGKERPSGWSDFIADILLDIAEGILGAAAAVAETVTAGAASAGIVAVLALTTELVNKLTSDDLGGNLDGVIGEFKTGQDNLYYALYKALNIMGSDSDNYKNLKEAFKGGYIDFNGKPYTLSDLAKADFPTVTPVNHHGEVYEALQDAAMLQFKKYFWNVMIAKAGTMIMYKTGNNVARKDGPTAYEIVRDIYINEPARVASYMRGYFQHGGTVWDDTSKFVFAEFYFEIDGRRLSAIVAKELFIDTVRDNPINPTGLFHRDYVYKQFHLERPDFRGFHELQSKFRRVIYLEDNFDVADDNYEFTGGLLKSLTKPG